MTPLRHRIVCALTGSAVALVAAVLHGDQVIVAQKVLVQQEDFEVVAQPLPAKRAVGRGGEDPDRTGGPDLVKYRPEITADIRQAERFVASGEFARALDTYLELMKEEAGSVMPIKGEPGSERLFVGIFDEIQRRIGKLPAAGLQRYRAEVDPTAMRLMEKGREGDLPALLEVVDRFRHSSVGAEALELAASRLFDRTEFALAARLWELWLRELSTDRAGKPAVLIRLAMSYQYLGRAEAAGVILKQLREDKDLARAEVLIAGRRTPAAVWLENFLREPTVVTLRRPAWFGGPDDWPGPAGNPAGSRHAGDAEVVLEPLWHDVHAVPTGEAQAAPQPRNIYARRAYGPGGVEPVVGEHERPVPALVGNRVYVRYPHVIRVFDLKTGQWKVNVETEDPSSRPTPERGRGYITVADGRMFTVERFPASTGPQQMVWGAAPSRGRAVLGNRLVARNAQTGALIWRTGRSRHDNDDEEELPRSDLQKLLDQAIILTAPTYSAGRLFAVAAAGDTFHAVCIEAANGRPVWARYLSHRPVAGNAALLGSPPAVTGGVVYCLSNAGTAAAFDETDGRVLWIFQYLDAARARNFGGAVHPPNAVCVTGDRLFCLPSDSEKLYCLRTGTGEMIWSAERAGAGGTGLPWLAGVTRKNFESGPADVVVLAGHEVKLFTASGGKQTASIPLSEDPTGAARVRTLGRPALSANAVYISVADRGIARVGINDGRVSYSRLPAGVDAESVPLGTLLPAGGRIIACDRLSSAAYVPFRERYQDSVDPPTAEGLFRRGLLAAGAGEPARGKADFEKALPRFEAEGDAARAREVRFRLYQVHLVLAGKETDAAARRTLLESAAALAKTPRDRIESRLHLSRALMDLKNWSAALDAAQSVAVEFPPTRVDGAALATAASRTASAADLSDSHVLAQALAAEIVGRDRSAYAKWDTAAEGDFKAALSAEPESRIDALHRILRTYPHAATADRVLHRLAVEHASAAAEIAARSAGSPAAQRRDGELRATRFRAQAVKHLDRVINEYPASALRATALANLVMLESLLPDSDGSLGRLCLRRLAELPADAQIEAADGQKRAVREFLARYGNGAAPAAELPADVLPNRTPVGTLGPAHSRLLRGTDGRPLLYDGKILLVTPESLDLIDPATAKPVWRSAALRAAVPRQIQPRFRGGVNVRFAARLPLRMQPATPQGGGDNEGASTMSVGGIASVDDGGVKRDLLVTWDGRRVVSVDLKSGRMLWVCDEGVSAAANLSGDFHNGMFALIAGAQKGEAVLVDPIRRTVLRPNLLHPAQVNVPPVLGPGGAAFLTQTPNGLDFVEAAQGRGVFREEIGGGVQRAVRTVGGGVLYQNGVGRLTALDIDGRTAWGFGSPETRIVANILFQDAEFTVVACQRPGRTGADQSELAVLDSGTGRLLWTFATGTDKGAGWVQAAVRRGDEVVATIMHYGPQGGAADQRLAVFHLRGDGKPKWTQSLSTADGAAAEEFVSATLLTRNQIAVYVSNQNGRAGRLVRLNPADGRKIGEEKFLAVGNPEIVAGVLLSESPDGVRLYGAVGPVWKTLDGLRRALREAVQEALGEEFAEFNGQGKVRLVVEDVVDDN